MLNSLGLLIQINLYQVTDPFSTIYPYRDREIAFHVLVKALISLDPGEEMELLKKHFQEFISGLMSLPINLPGTKLYQSLQAKKKMVKLVRKTIQAVRNKGVTEVPKDVVDVLLNDTNEKLTDDLIADNIIDMLIPREDSVPVLMTLATKYLTECPVALQQLTEESIKLKRLKNQLGESLCWSDYLSLPFTQKVSQTWLLIETQKTVIYDFKACSVDNMFMFIPINSLWKGDKFLFFLKIINVTLKKMLKLTLASPQLQMLTFENDLQ